MIGKKASINPVMNAVADAFSRRRFAGRFRYGSQSVELDTLLNESTTFSEDNDEKVAKCKNKRPKSSSKNASDICFLFQTDDCRWAKCRYRHNCRICNSSSHGMAVCPQRLGSAGKEKEYKLPSGNEVRSDKPPNPRSRRDRARREPSR